MRASSSASVHRGLVREAGEDRVLEALELLAHRGVDARVGVAEQVHPPGADAVEVALAGEVLEPHARSRAQRDHRHGLVVLHLRARMPDVREIARHPVGIAESWRSCVPFRGRLLWHAAVARWARGSAMRVDVSTGLLVGVKQVLSPFFDERPAGVVPDLIVLHGISLPPGEFGGPWIARLFTGQSAGRGAPGVSRARGLARLGAPADPSRRRDRAVRVVQRSRLACGQVRLAGARGLQRLFHRHRVRGHGRGAVRGRAIRRRCASCCRCC